MTRRRDSGEAPSKEIRAELSSRLREQSAEIEGKIVPRIRGMSEPVGDEDASYLEGLQIAVSEALSYGLDCVEMGGGWSGPIPPGVTRQARRSARAGVRLDTVLRRYAAGNKVLEEFIVAEAGDIPREVLCRILNDQGPQFDRLMESVAVEYGHELEQVESSSVQKRVERVLRLLSGDDGPEGGIDLDYGFDVWHVGMILTGPQAETTVRLLSEQLGYRLLHILRDSNVVWAWLGSKRQPAIGKLVRSLAENLPPEISLAIGEPREGLDGWRQTHHEAQMASRVMLGQHGGVTRCRDVILTSAIMRDESLASSLIATYLTPLDGRGDIGTVLRETLRAYFKADRSIATAAAALGVHRQTIERRLRSVEEKLGQTIDSCDAQLQVALSVEELRNASKGPHLRSHG